MSRPEVWLRGRVPDVPALLQPVAHALLQAAEDVERATRELAPGDLWRQPGDAAPPGFHLKHIAGSTDRLFTYARGDQLTEAQRRWLAFEQEHGSGSMTQDQLVDEVQQVTRRCVAQLRTTPIELLTTQRLIGRAQRETSVLGCLYHAGEHAARHAGQLVSTIKALRGGEPSTAS